MTATNEKITNSDNDTIACICGNTADSSGFYAYNSGNEVEPTLEDWDGESMFCAACLRVFRQSTGTVIDHPRSIRMLDGVVINRDD